MEVKLLLAGNPGGLMQTLYGRFEASGAHALVAVPKKGSREGQKEGTDLEADGNELAWTKRSPISAKAVVTAAYNRLGQSFDTILVCDLTSAGSAERAPSAAEVERRIDDEIKAALYLSREVTERRVFDEPARLSFVLVEGSEPRAPIDRLVLRGLEGFAESLFESKNIIRGFRCVDDDTEGFAQAVVDEIAGDGRKSRGRWLVHGKRSVLGLFSGR